MSIASLIITAVVIFAVIILAGALIGLLINLAQCLIFAAVAAIALTFISRFLLMRQPASKQVVDQTPKSVDDQAQVAQQIEARKEQLQHEDERNTH
jgi:membrane protein implicated in regulation of membrane protease activity